MVNWWSPVSISFKMLGKTFFGTITRAHRLGRNSQQTVDRNDAHMLVARILVASVLAASQAGCQCTGSQPCWLPEFWFPVLVLLPSLLAELVDSKAGKHSHDHFQDKELKAS